MMAFFLDPRSKIQEPKGAEAFAIFAALTQNGRGQQLQIGGGGFALPANEVDAAAAGFDVYLPMWP